jgi:hypothetical protein
LTYPAAGRDPGHVCNILFLLMFWPFYAQLLKHGTPIASYPDEHAVCVRGLQEPGSTVNVFTARDFSLRHAFSDKSACFLNRLFREEPQTNMDFESKGTFALAELPGNR